MRCYKGFWFYQGKVYPTLRAALLAAWSRPEKGDYGKEKTKTEYKWTVWIQHKVTRKYLNFTVWAPNSHEAICKLCGVLIGPRCAYEWFCTVPVYKNKQHVKREAPDGQE